MIESKYNPADIEARITQKWEDVQAFRSGQGGREGAEPFSIVIPPPNVTGTLHMGHALNNTLQDVLVRFERMRGRDVLWQVGLDHAGIATQMVVERQLAADKLPGRRELGRTAFIEKIWAWKAESGGTIIGQLKRLGASCDWSRERFTMDEGLSRAVAKVFVTLYKDGLIYRDKRLVNWDPKFQTAISDLEVQPVEVKGNLWHFKYPVENEGIFITVATTRPETMLGDTAVAVHPDDARYQHVIGKYVILPLVGRRIRIVADDYSDPEKGSGAVKITPAHDFNDFEVGKRHNLRMITVLDAEARLDVRDNSDFLDGAVPSTDLDAVLALHGTGRMAARKAVVALMEERGLLEQVEPTVHMVPHGDRSNAVIEPRLTDQWYVDAKTMAQPALEAVRSGKTVFTPKNWEKTYFDWLDNIEPWCISRQLWWGHQIPAWFGMDGTLFVEETEEEALAKALAHYVTQGLLTKETARQIAAHPERALEIIRRDEDVLDTWFSSALWPFSTMGWPESDVDVKRYYPTNVLITGFDIIFFWIARMMMMGLHFMGEVPFRDIYIHALVRDEKGAKMSKSKGNVIDPLDLIDKFGADALRFTLVAMAAQGRDIRLAASRVEGYRNFTTKLWNATRFAGMNGCKRREDFDPAQVTSTLNRWIVGETAQAAADITKALEDYRFNDAAGSAYRFVWNVFCDWYLELSKPVLQGQGEPQILSETQATCGWVLDQIFMLLHPFMPFITEELWALTAPPSGRNSVLALAPWPAYDALEDAEAKAEITWLITLVTEIRSIRVEMNVPAGAQIPLVLISPSAQTRDYAGRYDVMLKRLARLADIGFANAPPAGAIQLVVAGDVAALPLGSVMDLDSERVRLTKEMGKVAAEIAKIDAKLANEGFMARAPEDVITGEKDRRMELVARQQKLSSALERLQVAA
jgi:valyl-tRNA synthetase